MRDQVIFAVNGRTFRVGGREIFTTLANWLRYRACATGTSFVCEEGGCGACTVLVRRSTAEDFKPVNSCILTLAQMDGVSIVTVEGLGFNSVQQAMVAHHGAQCGYCTPGFVVAMSGMFECCDRVTEVQVRDGLTGNLCRCTGYEPIVKAALAVSATPKLRDRYPSIPEALDAFRIEDFYAPTTIAEAVDFKASHPGCTIVQGATDVGVWITKRNFTAPAMLSLSKIEALNAISEENGHIAVGANVTLTQFESAIEDKIPERHRIMHVFGSPQIKNAGTPAGNSANGSPIGDTLPYLFVADAQLELAGSRGTRLVPINSFYLGYKKFDLQQDEIITRVFVPVVKDTLKLYKVSRRRDLDISAFTAAIRLRVNGHIEEARVAYGGVAPTVVRLPKTEAFLTGKAPSLDIFARAGEIARSEVKPISDVRGGAAYRSQLAENIFLKFWFDAFPSSGPSGHLLPREKAQALSLGRGWPLSEAKGPGEGPIVGKNIPHDSARGHVTGESLYVDDVPFARNELLVDFFWSPVAHGRIRSLDTTAACNVPGVVALFTYQDLAHNLFGPIIKDEILLAENEVMFIGQPIVVIAAETREAIRAAKAAIKIDIEKLEP